MTSTSASDAKHRTRIRAEAPIDGQPTIYARRRATFVSVTSRSRAAIVFIVVALFAGGAGTALYMRERDVSLAADDAGISDASVDARADARAAKAKPVAKKKVRGGKTQVASRNPAGTHAHGANSHATPRTSPPSAPPAQEGDHGDHGTGAPAATAAPHHHRSHAPPSGPTYESALDSNHQHVTIGGHTGPDLTDAQLAGPMSDGSFIGECDAPDDMGVTVKVAIKNGRAVGVSVVTHPPSSDVAGCVDRHVRGLSWPSSPKLDSFVTTY